MKTPRSGMFCLFLVKMVCSEILQTRNDQEPLDIRKYLSTTENTWLYYKNYPDQVYKAPRPCLYDATVNVSKHTCLYDEYWGNGHPEYQQTLNGTFSVICERGTEFSSLQVYDEKARLYKIYTLYFVDEDNCSVMAVNFSPQPLNLQTTCAPKSGSQFPHQAALLKSGPPNCELRLREHSLYDGPGEKCQNVYRWSCGDRKISVYDPSCLKSMPQR
uniref:Lipocalin n=1 Tax=Amblyomma maculatum TaxID=34609 RepID=G3MKF1_AMBMU